MHEGHRQRIYDKLEADDSFADHELLEALLFSVLPRVNTNPIAHALIDRFRSLSGVLNASAEELMQVDGVGRSAAMQISLVNKICRRYTAAAESEYFGNYGKIYTFVRGRLAGKISESVEFYCLEKDGTIKRIYSDSSLDAHKILIDPQSLVDIIAYARPVSLVVAHNHPQTDCEPSAADDDFTRQLQIICSMNNVNLIDHCIYSNKTDRLYSYFNHNRLDDIKKNFSADKLLREWTQKNRS